jgi:hypothetical protein
MWAVHQEWQQVIMVWRLEAAVTWIMGFCYQREARKSNEHDVKSGVYQKEALGGGWPTSRWLIVGGSSTFSEFFLAVGEC